MSLADLTEQLHNGLNQVRRFFIFEQQRVGLEGRTFTIYKFRTMSDELENLHEELAMKMGKDRFGHISYDPRVIPFIGNFMRITRLDELPQFYNVISGDMSMFGPRPLTLYDHKPLPAEERELREKFKPGLIPINLLADYLKIRTVEDLRASDQRYNLQRLNCSMVSLKYLLSILGLPVQYLKNLYNPPVPFTL